MVQLDKDHEVRREFPGVVYAGTLHEFEPMGCTVKRADGTRFECDAEDLVLIGRNADGPSHQNERALIVAWIRNLSTIDANTDKVACASALADAIERGEHLGAARDQD